MNSREEKQQGPAALGWHWVLDGLGCERAALADQDLLRAALIELPGVLGLTRVAEPQLFEHQASTPEASCLVGIALLAESHLSLHLRPALGLLHADVFSCVNFEPALARDYLARRYGFVHHAEQRLVRGAALHPPGEAHGPG